MRSLPVSGLVFCGHPGGCDSPATCAAAAGAAGDDYPVDARCADHADDMLESDADAIVACVLAEDIASLVST